MMETQRNKQIDTAKGILMTSVIFGHVLMASSPLDATESFLLKLIYSFHMPAFLLISGMLFDCTQQKSRSLSEYLCTRIKCTLIPYFLFELLGGTIQNIFSYGKRETVLAVLKRVLTFQMYVGADWYLLTYFLAVMLVFMVNKVRKSEKILPLSAVVLFVVVCVFQNSGMSGQYIFLLRILLAYSLIVAGIELKRILLSYEWKKMCASVVGLSASVIMNANVFLHAVMLGNPILFLIGSVSGTYLILQIASHILINCRWISYLGRYSIIPMGIHQDIIWIFGWFFGLSGKWTVLIPNFIVTYLTAITVTMIYRNIVGRGKHEPIN